MNPASDGACSHSEDFEIRAAHSDELGAFAQVWHEADAARRDVCGTADTEAEGTETYELLDGRWSVPDATFLVAIRAEHIVGVAHALPARERDGAGGVMPRLMHLSMLAVAPECWGHGIGRALVRSCVDRATMLGYRAVALWTHDSNERAQRLYARLGFVREGREKTDEYQKQIRLYIKSLEQTA